MIEQNSVSTPLPEISSQNPDSDAQLVLNTLPTVSSGTNSEVTHLLGESDTQLGIGNLSSLSSDASSAEQNPVQVSVSFSQLMPIPHRERSSTVKRGRKKPPSSEFTSTETMNFVMESMNKSKPKPKRKKIFSKGQSNDNEPCAKCKFAYGDKKDPRLSENWEKCSKCKKWFHETCAALGGSYNKQIFTCDTCSAKPRSRSK